MNKPSDHSTPEHISYDIFQHLLKYSFGTDISEEQQVRIENICQSTFRACDNDNDKDLLNHLISCLNDIAKRLSVHTNSYIDNYNHFLANSDAYIDKDIENFIDNIDTIHSSYYLFDEYLEDKSFSKAVENLDMKLTYSCIEETRKKIKNKRKSHLSPDLIEKLLAANKEIMILYNTVQRQHDAHKNKVAKRFFKDNLHIFKILEYDDIKDLEFSSDPNGIRNARRKLFTNIAERAGKPVSGSKIAKELAFE